MLRFCGFGGCAGMVITRAIVRDLADGHAAARLMSRLTLVMGAGPILAPTLGGVVMSFAGWQAILRSTHQRGMRHRTPTWSAGYSAGFTSCWRLSSFTDTSSRTATSSMGISFSR